MKKGHIRVKEDNSLVFEYISGSRVVKDKNGVPYRYDTFYARIPFTRDSIVKAGELIDEEAECEIIEKWENVKYSNGESSRTITPVYYAKL